MKLTRLWCVARCTFWLVLVALVLVVQSPQPAAGGKRKIMQALLMALAILKKPKKIPVPIPLPIPLIVKKEEHIPEPYPVPVEYSSPLYIIDDGPYGDAYGGGGYGGDSGGALGGY